MAEYYVYIMSNTTGMLYTGVTNNIARRVVEHKTKQMPGFTAKYNITELVCCESTEYIDEAIAREKQIKGWVRKKKVDLINSMNPDWRDLSWDFMDKQVVEELRDPSLRSG